MQSVLGIERHTEVDVVEFSEKIGITLERARYIENMRENYILWEHDYLKECPEMD